VKTKRYKATVFIPTYNGEKYIGQILDALFVQKVDYEYDVLIIDSGSRDNTRTYTIHNKQQIIPKSNYHN
jgi:glycosyltransferase involved in cell wall biosynthesis